MAGRGNGPDFVEALARGLDILAAFGADHRSMSLSEVAAAAALARPTARRLLLTLEELGYVRSGDGTFELTPKVMNLGMAYVSSLGLWDVARPHMEALVARTGESSSMAQLDGSDIVYVARVSVPKLIALRVEIGTHFPAVQTSQGKVLLAALPPDQVAAVVAQPSRSGLPPYYRPAAGPAARRAVRGAGAGLGASRRGTRARRPFGRRPGQGRDRGGPGRDERHRARGRDHHPAAAARSPAAAAHHGRRDQRAVGDMAFLARTWKSPRAGNPDL